MMLSLAKEYLVYLAINEFKSVFATSKSEKLVLNTAWPLVQIQSLFSRKPCRKKKMCFLFPIKMSPTLIWYFTQGLKPSNR